MSDETSPAVYAGVDWATQKHDVCVVDDEGHVLGERAFAADAAGLTDLMDWLTETAGVTAARIAVAIEVPHGPVVEALLERGFAVHSINPKQLDRFRDRFSLAGAKDDRRDARVLADSLRTDRRAYRRIDDDDPDVIELREWSRMASELTVEDGALCNRARQQLWRFYPQLLEISSDPGEPFALALFEAAPTPAKAHRLRLATIEKLLADHKIRRWKADEALAVLRKPALVVAPGTVEAAVGHLRQLAARIRLVRRQIAECRAKLDEIMTRLGAEEAQGRKNEPRDAEILLSLPGFGRIVVASVLAEASRPLRERDYQAIRTQSGAAPVTRRSGKTLVVEMRRACNPQLRKALFYAARAAAQSDPIWQSRLLALRARGQSYGRACRGIADALLRVAVAMLQSRTLYDPAKIGATRAKAVA